MDAEWLVQLATSGATTLVTAAATELWKDTRQGFLRMLGRGDPQREELAGQRLDALAEAVQQAPEPQRDAVRRQQAQMWQTRLADLLQEDPEMAQGLRELTKSLQQRQPAGSQQWVSAGRDAFVAGRDQHFGTGSSRPS
jgi:hypothetical protein